MESKWFISKPITIGVIIIIFGTLIIYLWGASRGGPASNYFTCAQSGIHDYSPVLGTSDTTTFICTQKVLE